MTTSSLRWILAAAGVLLVLGIYVWDRMRRISTDAPSAQRHSNQDREMPRANASRGNSFDAAVPQLDEAVVVRARIREPSVLITNDDSLFDSSDLPPIHTIGHATTQTNEYSEVRENAVIVNQRREPSFDVLSAEGLSTGAFITAQSQQYPHHSEPNQAEPTISVEKATPHHLELPQTKADEVPPRPIKKHTSSRKIIALRLSAGSTRVEGSRLKSLLETAGLQHGKYSIYHRLHSDGTALFSVASMVEPGTFDPHAMSGVQFPGVTLFTQLPGPIDGNEMIEQMLTGARQLEQGMGGILQDERGLPLTEPRVQRLRDDVADFLHLLG